MTPTKLVPAFLMLVLASSAPGLADDAAACPDLYICTEGGNVVSVSGALTFEGGTATVAAERRRGQRFSSAGHLDIDDARATLTLRLIGAPAQSCSPDPAALTYEASDVIDEIRVTSTDPGCAFDLVWASAGTPSASTDRTTTLAPGVPPAFAAIAAVGATVRMPSTVGGTVGDLEASGTGEKRQHGYVGHVTLIR